MKINYRIILKTKMGETKPRKPHNFYEILIIIILAIIIPCHASQSDAKDRIRLVLSPSNGHPWYLGSKEFKKKVFEDSNKKLDVQIFPSATLLPALEQFDGVINGLVDMAIINAAYVTNLVRSMKIFELPFLFSDYEQATDFLESHFGAKLLKEMEGLSHNQVKALAYLPSSFNLIANNNRPIRKLSDLKGLKIRTTNNPIKTQTIRYLGANPIPMAWGEINTALRQGVIDGLSVSPYYFLETGIHEVSKYISTLPISYSPGILIFNSNRWEKLTAKDKEIINRSIPSLLEIVDTEIKKQNATLMSTFKKSIYEVENLIPFKESAKPIFDQAEEYGLPVQWVQTAAMLSYETFNLEVRSEPQKAKIRYRRRGLQYHDWHDTTNCPISNLRYAIWEIEVSNKNKTLSKFFDPYKSINKVIIFDLN